MEINSMTLARYSLSLLVGSLLLAAAFPTEASDSAKENWGHWRGEGGNGVSTTATPPVTWSDTENVKWKVAVPGRGSGSPVVWDQRVFVVTAIPAEGDAAAQEAEPQEANVPRRDFGPPQDSARQGPGEGGRGVGGRGEGRRGEGRRGGGRFGGRRGGPLQKLKFDVLCYDRANGELLWQETAAEATPHEGTHGTNGYASGSPCTDGKHVFAHFGSQGIHCYTVEGKHVWSRQLGKLIMRNGFGEGSSPTLVEGNDGKQMVIVPWDHEGDSYLFALDAKTGEPIWKTPRDEPSCWATPLVVDFDAQKHREHDGRKQIVMNGQTCARGYDLETGEELWRCGGQTERPVASAVATDGLIFVGSGHRGSFFGAFRPDGRGDIQGTESVVWTKNRDTPDIASPLLSEGRLYYTKGKSGIVTCLDATTGKPHYVAKRTELGQLYASPIAAGGHVYITDRNGTTVVLKDAEQFEVIATNNVGETVDATPAPVGDELIIRGEKHLFCVGG